MALTNYTELKTAVATWLHRSNLTANIPDFIALLEAYLNNELRARAMITDTTINPSQSVKYLALPTGFNELISLNDDLGEPLGQLVHNELVERQYESGAQRPEYFSITSQINFECLADDSYDYTISYYKNLDIATDSTNDVLTNYPNLYLYGSLIQAEPFMKNDKRMVTWMSLYEKALKDINNKNTDSIKKLRSDHISLASNNYFNINRGY